MRRRFLTLKKGYTPETPIFTTISRNNQRNITLEQPLEFFVCLFVFTGIFVPITFWILTPGYSLTWQICGGCKLQLSEYLLNNVGLNCLKHYFKSKYVMWMAQYMQCLVNRTFLVPFLVKPINRKVNALQYNWRKVIHHKSLFYSTFWYFSQ